MLEHTHGDDLVEVAAKAPIAHQFDAYRQTGAARLSEVLLLLRGRDAGYFYAIVPGRESG